MAEDLKLEGSMVALVTPFRKGEVDWDALGRLIDFQLANGNQGLIPCGSTGESPTLTHEEHDAVIEFTINRAAGKVPVIAGTGSNSTAEAARLTQHAKDAGADACMIVNPYYNKPTQRGMYQHVAEIAKIGLPIVLYNNPGRTASEMSPQIIIKMYKEIEQVVAVKEATGKLDSASAIAAACDMAIVSGDDSLTLPMAAVGGRGVISVLANIVPKDVKAMTDAALAGDWETAKKWHHKMFRLAKGLLTLEVNPIPIKTAMAMRGMIEEEFRLPLCKMQPANRDKLEAALKDYGI